jgi:hypothetical protein
MLELVEVFWAMRVRWWVYVWLVATRVYGKNYKRRVQDTGDRRVPLYPEHNSGMPWFRGAYAVTAWLFSLQATKLGSTGVARAHAKRVFVVPTDVEIVALAWLV